MAIARDEVGKFASKSDDERRVRSIRATDEVWEAFGELAEERRITRADLLEQIFVDSERVSSVVEQDTFDEVVELLQEALTLKANAGGSIKKLIRECLELLGADTE